MPKDAKRVIELEFEPDDYLCTWHIAGPDGTTLNLPGSIEVQPDRMPRGVIHGDIPIESTSNGHETSFSFPQRRSHNVVKATIANGGAVLIVDATITWWVSHGSVRGAAALLQRRATPLPGQPALTDAGEPGEIVVHGGVRFQVEGLDAILGVGPLGSRSVPMKATEEGTRTWNVTSNPASNVTWESDGTRLTAEYRGKGHVADPFGFDLRFGPLLEAFGPEPVTVFEAIEQWVDPIRAISSIATGRSQKITYLAMVEPAAEDPADRSPFDRGWQVFGTGLAQNPYESHIDDVREQRSAVACVEDGLSLLGLVKAWGALKVDHHPLIETYAGMIHAKDQHPRSRFLLLVQSLEGWHGHETRSSFEVQLEAHKTRRKDVLASIRDHAEGETFRFIKKYLAKEPFRNLEVALQVAFLLPVPIDDVADRLAATRLVQLVRAEDSNRSVFDAVRLVRNSLAHGTRGYDARDLDQVNDILDRVVRAHALRLLGCPDQVLIRVFDD